MERKRMRWTALASVALIAGSQLVVHLTAATPAAAAVIGLSRVVTAETPSGLAATKEVRANCPSGQRVIGGGGWIDAENGFADLHSIVLTELRPGQYSGGRGYYQVGAEATPGFGGRWALSAYALCTGLVSDGYQIRSTVTTTSSQSVKVANVGCPGDTRAYGSGARITDGRGEVGIQVMRPSGPGDIVRTQARELAGGYSGNWRLTGYAVCAVPQSSYEVVFGPSPQSRSEQYKIGLAECPNNKRVVSTGGAIIDWAPGGTALVGMRPSEYRRQVTTVAAETTPISPSWDLIVAAAVCSY